MPLIIDLDNTLYSYDISNQYALERIAEHLRFNHKIDPLNFKDTFKLSRDKLHATLEDTASSHNKSIQLKLTLENLNIFSFELLREVIVLYEQSFISKMFLYEGVESFLKSYKEKICVLTDYTLDFQLKKLNALGIENYIDYIVCSEEVGKDKPSKKMFATALEIMNCSSSKTVMIGDNFEKDYLGAKIMGLESYLYVRDGSPSNNVQWFNNFNDLCI